MTSTTAEGIGDLPSCNEPADYGNIATTESIEVENSAEEAVLVNCNVNEPSPSLNKNDLTRSVERVMATRQSQAIFTSMRRIDPEGGSSATRYRDHFTLPNPSSTVRFRSSAIATHVYESKSSQFIIEDDKGTITVKRMNTATAGLQFLRLVYTIVVLFWTGFLVVFCVQVLLFLISDLTIEIGATSTQAADFGQAIGSILSLPVYIHGLASALVIAGHYIYDTWGGFSLVRNFVFGRFNNVITAWITFFCFLGIPLLVMCITLCTGTSLWWNITALTWFSFVCAFYVLFAATVVYFECQACLEILKNRYNHDNDAFLSLLSKAIALRQISRYSGEKTKIYVTRGNLSDPTGVDEDFTWEENIQYHTGWYSKFTLWPRLGKWKLFDTVDPARRVFTVDDAQGIRPFVTYDSWSLEKIYCRARQSRAVAVVKGPAALTRQQMRSSFVCALFGNLLALFLLISVLVWLGIDGWFILIFVILVGIFYLPSISSSYRIWKLTKDVFAVSTTDENIVDEQMNGKGDDDDEGEIIDGTENTEDVAEMGDSEGLYQVWETYRIATPTVCFCWIMFGLEVACLFLYPLFALYSIGNYVISTLFLFVALFSALRYYLNAAVVLEEVGHMHFVRGGNEREKWKNRSRLHDIMTNISRSRSRGAWNAVLIVFIFVFLLLFLGAVGQSSDSSSDEQLQYLPNFSYDQEDDLRYPTCNFGKGLEDSPSRLMADYAYLAGLAYRNNDITQSELDQWFVNLNGTTAQDNPDIVEEFRSRTQSIDSAVSYKLLTFSDESTGSVFAIVSIRGTTNAWDMLADAQLWSAAACMQMLRAILPLGEMWTPIIHNLINAIHFLQSASLERVSFYKQTAAFVRELQQSGQYENVQVTGHSLGGGLALITGAQTGAPAVGLSAPNAMLSRDTFGDVTVDKLNKKTFNIIPDRDPVARIDDVADLFQRISCKAPANAFVDCHFALRSLCEILHTCGTQGRPALCECVTNFGYPEPESVDGSDFKTACGITS